MIPFAPTMALEEAWSVLKAEKMCGIQNCLEPVVAEHRDMPLCETHYAQSAFWKSEEEDPMSRVSTTPASPTGQDPNAVPWDPDKVNAIRERNARGGQEEPKDPCANGHDPQIVGTVPGTNVKRTKCKNCEHRGYQ